MTPTDSARENQLRCAGEYLDESNSASERRGAWLGVFDYFAEEFILEYDQERNQQRRTSGKRYRREYNNGNFQRFNRPEGHRSLR